MITLAAKDGENQVLYPICSPALISALQRSNWGSSIAYSVMYEAVSMVQKLSIRNDSGAHITNGKLAARGNCTPIQLLAWLTNGATLRALALSVSYLSYQRA